MGEDPIMTDHDNTAQIAKRESRADAFAGVWAAWLAAQAAAAADSVDQRRSAEFGSPDREAVDRQTEEVCEAVDKAISKLIATPANDAVSVRCKLDALVHLIDFEREAGFARDGRVGRLATSIRADVGALTA